MKHVIDAITHISWSTETVTLAISAAGSLFTLWYVLLTRWLVLHERRAAVVARVLFTPEHFNLLFLEVRNIGKETAHNIKITFDPDATLANNKTLSEVFGDIPILLPNEALPIYLGNAIDKQRLMAMFPNLTLKVGISWRDESKRFGRTTIKDTPINLVQFEGMLVIGTNDEVAKAIDRLGDALAMSGLFREPAEQDAAKPSYDKNRFPTRMLQNPVLWTKVDKNWHRVIPQRVAWVQGRHHLSPVLSAVAPAAFRLEREKSTNETLYIYIDEPMNSLHHFNKVIVLERTYVFFGYVAATKSTHQGLHGEEQLTIVISHNRLRHQY